MTKSQELPALSYKGHEDNKLTLHLFLQIIGKIRLKMTPRKNHWWYITEYIDTQGFTTGPVPYHSGVETFTITLNVHHHQLEVVSSKGERKAFNLEAGLQVGEFYNKLMAILKELDISVSILDKPYDLPIDKRFKEITEYQHYDKTFVKQFWRTMLWVDGVFKEFSGRFYGKTCPVHLYWHSLDLAVTRFSGKEAPPMDKGARISDKDAYTHECISFGFWAGDQNMQEPAFYSYTYPSPKGMDKKTLQPEKAFWIDSNGSPMAILRYNDLKQMQNPREALLDFMESAYQAGASLAGWEIDKLTVPDLKEL